jgi:two-component sensor histidine kinase
VGLPIDFNIDDNDSLGLSLIKGLSKQLGGIFELISDVGVRIRVVFPKQRFIEQKSVQKMEKNGVKYEY